MQVSLFCIHVLVDPCSLAPVKGGCQDYVLKWSYNQKEQACRQFWLWRLWGQNANPFETKEACEAGVFQFPYRVRKSLSAAASILKTHGIQMTFPETLPHSSEVMKPTLWPQSLDPSTCEVFSAGEGLEQMICEGLHSSSFKKRNWNFPENSFNDLKAA